MDKPPKKQRLVTVIAFFVAFGVTSVLFKSCKKDGYEGVKEVSDEMNRKCPLKADEYTRLDSTSVTKEPLTIAYYFTATEIDTDEVEVDVAGMKKEIQKNCQANLDTMPSMKAFREYNVSMNYFYKDIKGKPLFDFSIHPQKP